MFWSNTTEIPSDWHTLDASTVLESLVESSQSRPVVVFKHSTRCSISAFAFHRLKEGTEQLVQASEFYYLDLLKHRNVSDAIASKFQVHHQSPQVLVIKKGTIIGHFSHDQVDTENVLQLLN